MKTYRVKGYETVMYYVDIKAKNKSDAYTKAMDVNVLDWEQQTTCLLYTSPSPRDMRRSRMPSSA